MFPKIHQILLFLVSALLLGGADRAWAQSYTTAPLADGFDYPVGKPNAHGYYVYRGFSPGGHLGEDWNGDGGGNTDEGDPVYNIAHGVVVFSEDYRKGWGNVVIIRHAYREKNGQIAFVDSLYGHLKYRSVSVGQRVSRGEKVGSIGRGPYNMYAAHLHFEIRKDLRVGMRRDLYPKTYATYYSPRYFIDSFRQLRHESRKVRMPINTFLKSNPNRIETTGIDVPGLDSFSSAGGSGEGAGGGSEADAPSSTVRPDLSALLESVIEEETEVEKVEPKRSKSLLERIFSGFRKKD